MRLPTPIRRLSRLLRPALAAAALLATLPHAAAQTGPAVAFVKGGRLCVMNASGTSQTTLTTFSVGRPAYSPDGQWLAFEATTGAPQGYGVYVIRVDGAGLRKVVSKVSSSVLYGVNWALTPDGMERIAYTDRLTSGAATSLLATDLQGLDVVQLTNEQGDASPSFSRTGDTLYSCQDGDLVRLDLGVVAGRLAVVQSASLVYDYPTSPIAAGEYVLMSVSASKTTDLLVVDAWDPVYTGQDDLFVIDPANPAGAVNLTASFAEMCMHPAWSADGTRIVFSTKLARCTTIAQIPSGGGAITNLSNNTSKQTAHTKPAWRRQP